MSSIKDTATAFCAVFKDTREIGWSA